MDEQLKSIIKYSVRKVGNRQRVECKLLDCVAIVRQWGISSIENASWERLDRSMDSREPFWLVNYDPLTEASRKWIYSFTVSWEQCYFPSYSSELTFLQRIMMENGNRKDRQTGNVS